MLRLAVIGKDVSGSLSPGIHRFVLGKLGIACVYDAVSIPPCEFPSRAEKLLKEYDGLNVTIPFKLEILPFLRETAGDAKTFGAVNTVVCGTRTGYNTDGRGFMLMLENEGVQTRGKTVLVLGAGGAGRSCIKMLLGSGAEVSAYDLSEERLFAVFSEFGGFTPLSEVPAANYSIVVNCTGVGMHDTVGKLPSVKRDGTEVSSACLLEGAETAVDLIYTPPISAFLAEGERRGLKTVNGLGMLFYQAYLADCIFLKREADGEEAKRFYQEYREKIR